MAWLAAVLDVAADRHAAETAYWQAVSGHALAPHDGDGHLRLRHLAYGPARVHLDLHVEEVEMATARAVDLGAVEEAEHRSAVLRSPSGLPFCLVPAYAARPAAPATWPGGRSAVDQVCLDVGPSDLARETAFWSALLDQEVRPLPDPEFDRLVPDPALALKVLVQRRDDEGPATVHLDLAADDRDAEVARHEALGGVVVRQGREWTTLRDPAGLEYCVTDRRPDEPGAIEDRRR